MIWGGCRCGGAAPSGGKVAVGCGRAKAWRICPRVIEALDVVPAAPMGRVPLVDVGELSIVLGGCLGGGPYPSGSSKPSP